VGKARLCQGVNDFITIPDLDSEIDSSNLIPGSFDEAQPTLQSRRSEELHEPGIAVAIVILSPLRPPPQSIAFAKIRSHTNAAAHLDSAQSLSPRICGMRLLRTICHKMYLNAAYRV